MHTLKFTLRQHTPLIHFQHDQQDATLRATEVKPKLDKFILNVLPIILPEAAIQHQSAISKLVKAGEEKSPSLYKIGIEKAIDGSTSFYYFESNIRPPERDEVTKLLKEKLHQPNLKVISPSPFFANNDKRKDKKWDEIRLGVFFDGDIFVHVKTWDEEISNLLIEAIPLLFCVENFGMRQSKGFGSFSEKSISVSQFEDIVQASFVFAAKISAPTDQSAIFKTIDSVYKTLRYDNQAKDSAIEEFLRGKATLEKYKITQEVVSEEPYTEDKSEPVRFIRSVLGLPGLHDYPNLRDKPKVNIRDVSGEVERYKSPIMFKIFKNYMYLLANPVHEKMLSNRDFVFYVGNDPSKTTRKTIIPTLKSFSIKSFLDAHTPNGWETL